MVAREKSRLLFLYLLRASAVTQVQQVSVRLARRQDIPAIQSCNLKTLPENYATHFYTQHLETWPQLALVAEAPASNLAPPTHPGEFKLYAPRSHVVGYVLGKMEPGAAGRATRRGHITSLAVLPEYRRQGIAHELMSQVHNKMLEYFDAEASSLHVRVTNEKAIRLYRDTLGYTVVQTVPKYYQDGEDAFLMTAPLASKPSVDPLADDLRTPISVGGSSTGLTVESAVNP